MNMDKAIQILGINATRIPTRNMAKALGMAAWLNTEADIERKLAAEYVLRRWNAYQSACNSIRDSRFKA
jgi:hypothetical protein